jgi:hypothetical protein
MLGLWAGVVFFAGAALALPPSGTTSTTHTLRAGTPVTLILADDLKTRHVKLGQQISCRVAQAIMVDSCIAVPEGAPAVIEITEARNAGFIGRPDRLAMRAVSVTSATGQPVSLQGGFELEGEDRMVESLASSVVLSCLFFLVPGERVVLAKGTGWTAEIGYDTPITTCLPVAQRHR